MKTLKDLEDTKITKELLVEEKRKGLWGWGNRWVYENELKAVALEWIKFYKKKYEETDGLDEFKYSQAVYLAFQQFFNIGDDALT